MTKHLSYNNTTISYTIEGDGKAVVLLHGFLEDSSIWDEFKNRLIESHKVICIDLPGFGKSGIVEESHTMELMADVVNTVAISESIGRFTIIGHSMGGYVSLATADKYPEKLSGLVLFHSQGAADDKQAKINRDRTIEVVKNNHSKFISAFIPTLFAECNIEKYKSEIDSLTQTCLATNDQGIIAALSGMRDRKDYVSLLETIDIPILFIIGKQDSKIPLEKINQQIMLPKISETLVLDKVGHMGFIEAKENTFATICNFIDKYNRI